MKKLIFILGIVLCSLVSFGQRTIAADTLNGAETVTFATMVNPSQVQVLFTQVGGTSDGTANLEASLDGTSWETITETAGWFHFYPNDTMTITNGAVWIVGIDDDAPFIDYRVSGTGTASDSTLMSIKWSK